MQREKERWEGKKERRERKRVWGKERREKERSKLMTANLWTTDLRHI